MNVLKKGFVFFANFIFVGVAYSANLLDVYQHALCSDPIFQQAIATELATKEGVPVSLSALLPQASLQVLPSITRTRFSGSAYNIVIPFPITNGFPVYPRHVTIRAYTVSLNASQTIFNFAQLANWWGSLSQAKAAQATLNASLQNLMLRTASAYFAVLQAEDVIRYHEAAKKAYSAQFDQVKEQYKVGLKSTSEFYTAEAALDKSKADLISAQTESDNKKENLRVITGRYYKNMARLVDHFPLIRPIPNHIITWVQKAQCHNWMLKASTYNLDVARQMVRQQFAGHLPTIMLEGTMDRQYVNNLNPFNSFNYHRGPGVRKDQSIGFNINVPLFSGGGVNANTQQAIYNYKGSEQQLEQTRRDIINTTRRSYLGVISGIDQIKADQGTIKSSLSTLHAMQENYKIGKETLVNVLNQHQKVVDAYNRYASDRYAYVNNVLALKEAAGTLSVQDLANINTWLVE